MERERESGLKSNSCDTMIGLTFEKWHIQGDFKYAVENEKYYFTRLDRRDRYQLQVRRSTNEGYWKSTGKDKEITDGKNKKKIGYEKTFTFYEGKNKKSSNWIMHEFRESKNYNETNCSVLCKIYKKTPSTKNIRTPRHGRRSQNMSSAQPNYTNIGRQNRSHSLHNSTQQNCITGPIPYTIPTTSFPPQVLEEEGNLTMSGPGLNQMNSADSLTCFDFEPCFPEEFMGQSAEFPLISSLENVSICDALFMATEMPWSRSDPTTSMCMGEPRSDSLWNFEDSYSLWN